MPRKNVKLVRPKAKWSHENKGCLFTTSADKINGLFQGGSNIVPATTTQGTRTVGNFTITVPCTTSATYPYYWALVYCPQGTAVNNLFATSGDLEGSLYEPNQYVLASGMSDADAGPIRIKSRMKRVLHSGDFISLILGCPGEIGSATPIRCLVSYSIKYN